MQELYCVCAKYSSALVGNPNVAQSAVAEPGNAIDKAGADPQGKVPD